MRRYRVREGLLMEELDGECVILDMDRNVYFGLEAMGRALWGLLQRGESVEAIVEAMQHKYEGMKSAEQIIADVDQFVEKLLSRGLLHEVIE